MPYFAVDDKAHSHTKMRRANNAAIGLWTLIGSWVSQQLTDGHVPGEIAKMYGTAPQMRRLVSAGLWHEHGHACPRCPAVRPGDFYMHDYRESGNPSRAEVEARRHKDAEKKRRQRSGYSTPPPPPGQMPFDEEPPPGDEDAPPEEAARPPRQTAPAMAQIPDDWEPSAADVRSAQDARTTAGQPELTALQLAAVTRKFRRRQMDDGARAAAWGGRWQQWAENERVEQAGGVVVPFDQMTKSQQQRAGLAGLRERLEGGTA
ncbi:hypothetical protein GTX53_24255 [Streptomyces sp. SID5594]|uniref:hypothetical protein n=1 Tax=unclassified Streptomyces TaxID=2593676 RepID=UPI0003A65C3D|nr:MULTISPECIES: hypothetical protein [unclassified Streptomyces]MZF56905.1 hypothetical protein [Streptomyces sp. SID5594]